MVRAGQERLLADLRRQVEGVRSVFPVGLGVRADDRIGAFSAAGAAAPILMMLMALTAGARIVVADDAPRRNLERGMNGFALAVRHRDAAAALDTAMPS